MERRAVVILSLVAFAIVLTADVLYVTLINAQNASSSDDMPYVPRFVASYLAVIAALIALTLLPRPEIVSIRAPLRAASGAGLLGLGLLAAMSIGLPLVVAGILVVIAFRLTARTPRSRLRALAGLLAAVLSLGVLLVGLDMAGRVIVCPAVGQSGGGGTHLLGGTYRYECNNGELHMTSG